MINRKYSYLFTQSQSSKGRGKERRKRREEWGKSRVVARSASPSEKCRPSILPSATQWKQHKAPSLSPLSLSLPSCSSSPPLPLLSVCLCLSSCDDTRRGQSLNEQANRRLCCQCPCNPIPDPHQNCWVNNLWVPSAPSPTPSLTFSPSFFFCAFKC